MGVGVGAEERLSHHKKPTRLSSRPSGNLGPPLRQHVRNLSSPVFCKAPQPTPQRRSLWAGALQAALLGPEPCVAFLHHLPGGSAWQAVARGVALRACQGGEARGCPSFRLSPSFPELHLSSLSASNSEEPFRCSRSLPRATATKSGRDKGKEAARLGLPYFCACRVPPPPPVRRERLPPLSVAVCFLWWGLIHRRWRALTWKVPGKGSYLPDVVS